MSFRNSPGLFERGAAVCGLAGGFLSARYSARCGGLVSARSIHSLRGTPRPALRPVPRIGSGASISCRKLERYRWN
jgi:hypothetical protein